MKNILLQGQLISETKVPKALMATFVSDSTMTLSGNHLRMVKNQQWHRKAALTMCCILTQVIKIIHSFYPPLRERERERERERSRDHVIYFFFQLDIRSFKVTLGQSLWSMAMCLVWQSVLLENG